MAENSKIEWTDHTFNPWIGCTKVSPACDNCYAENWDKRYNGGTHWGPKAPRKRTSPKNWALPYKWNKESFHGQRRMKVFCASLADVFDNQVDPEWRTDLWRLIRGTPDLDWLLLTKRPQNVIKMLPWDIPGLPAWGYGWYNVGIGTSVEDQRRADQNIPALLSVPCRMRFLSMEPLLENVDLEYPPTVNPAQRCCGGYECGCIGKPTNPPLLYGIDWVIAGGESGPGALAMEPRWVISIRDQCEYWHVPFFFKQWGEYAPGEGEMIKVGKKVAGRILGGKTYNAQPNWRR